ncbi:MAG: SGNH/GDSL hydrolase family protein, partial [Planctomycetota bacterium]
MATAVFAGLVLAEVGLRVAAWLGAKNDLAVWRHQTAAAMHLTPGQSVRLGQMVRPATDPDIVYELLPDLDVTFCEQSVRTGKLGCRGGDPPPQREPGSFLLLGLGDSVMFGSSVATDATFLAVLERELQQHYPEHHITTVNTGVPGYNTTMEVATLASKFVSLHPDVVLIDFVENDFDLPNFLLLPVDPLRTDELFLWDLAHRALRKGRDPNGPLEVAPMANTQHFESDPGRVPAAYAHMVGVGAYRAALTRLRDLSREHGFRVLVSCHTEINASARQVCAELGLPVVTAAARQREWLAAHGNQALRA